MIDRKRRKMIYNVNDKSICSVIHLTLTRDENKSRHSKAESKYQSTSLLSLDQVSHKDMHVSGRIKLAVVVPVLP